MGSGGEIDAAAQVFYIRPDGGSAAQCNGRANAPYSAGAAPNCAWNHPFQALPPGGSPRISGGDTVVIASGSYRMGYGAPGADACEADWPYECAMPPIPSGPDAAHPTRFVAADCAHPPELWGAERAYYVINLTDSSNVELRCLEITDHAGCVEFHSGGLACERDSYPFGDWASTGLYAEDSANVHLSQIDIHGLASAGVHAGRLTDWTLENVRIAANGWVGWDGDLPDDDSNSGSLRFTRVTIEWNGCAETYPGEEPAGCWAQSAGGYGDGLGTGDTGGDWYFTDCAFLHNTSDGLDLLYHSLGGEIHLDRVRAEGNAGNPIKVTGQAWITNCLIAANCAYFEGQPFTYNVDACRAMGNALSLSFMGGETVHLTNSTLYGQGDGLIGAGPRSEGDCAGGERIIARNNLLLGGEEYLSPGDRAFVFYQEGCDSLTFDPDYTLVYGAKRSLYTPGPHDLEADPLLAGPLSGDELGLGLTLGSPAIDRAAPAFAPPIDFAGHPRVGAPDLGALEYGDWDEWKLFIPLTLWRNTFGAQAGGWTSQDIYPRMMGDVNGDGLADLVGCGRKGVYLALSDGYALGAPVLVLGAFGVAAGGWSSQDLYPRFLGDVNGDGRDDLIGCGRKGVYVALSNGSGFGAPALRLANFGADAGGWTSQALYPRMAGDVNGDGRDDLIGCGRKGVYVSLSNGSAFGAPALWRAAFGVAAGNWTSQDLYPRFLGDANGDGRADLIGCGHKGVYVALSTGSSLGAPTLWRDAFGVAAGNWTSQDRYPRMAADVDGDGRADLIGCGQRAAYVALSTGAAFAAPATASNEFTVAAGWTSQNAHPRMVGDLNGDSRADLLGCAASGAQAALSDG